jgi:hypothetical protein
MYFDDLLVGPTQCLARCSHNTDCECISFHHFSSEFCSSSRYWNALEMRAQNAPARPRSIETRSKCAFRYWRALEMRARVLAVLERAQNARARNARARPRGIGTRSKCARARSIGTRSKCAFVLAVLERARNARARHMHALELCTRVICARALYARVSHTLKHHRIHNRFDANVLSVRHLFYQLDLIVRVGRTI